MVFARYFGELTPPSLLFPTGCQLIMENSVVKDALYLLQDEVRDLINTMESTLKDQEAWHKKMLDEYHEQLDKVEEKLQKYSENGSEEVKNILKRLSSFEANLSMRLQAIEEGLADTYGRVEQLEQYQEHLNRRCDNADDKVEKIEDELTKLKIGASSKLGKRRFDIPCHLLRCYFSPFFIAALALTQLSFPT